MNMVLFFCMGNYQYEVEVELQVKCVYDFGMVIEYNVVLVFISCNDKGSFLQVIDVLGEDVISKQYK